jgi:hypothetical protein
LKKHKFSGAVPGLTAIDNSMMWKGQVFVKLKAGENKSSRAFHLNFKFWNKGTYRNVFVV